MVPTPKRRKVLPGNGEVSKTDKAGKAMLVKESDVLTLKDASAWKKWLEEHEDEQTAVFLRHAKKGVSEPTSLTYDQSLDEALCSGWIDGIRKGYDEKTFIQRYTPRRKGSNWSLRNVGLVARLIAAGRMRPRGQMEIDKAKETGRWPGSSS